MVNKTFAFIDASNLMYGSTRAGWKIDYAKLASYLRYRYNVNILNYFAGVDKSNTKQLNFYHVLEKLGFELYLVPLKTFQDGRKKADVDSRLTVEAIKNMGKYDKAIFITGDGDYYWLFEHLLENKKQLSLLGFHHNTAKELKQLFKSEFTDIGRLKDQISLTKKNAADAIVGSTAGIIELSIPKIKSSVKGRQKKIC